MLHSTPISLVSRKVLDIQTLLPACRALARGLYACSSKEVVRKADLNANQEAPCSIMNSTITMTTPRQSYRHSKSSNMELQVCLVLNLQAYRYPRPIRMSYCNTVRSFLFPIKSSVKTSGSNRYSVFKRFKDLLF